MTEDGIRVEIADIVRRIDALRPELIDRAGVGDELRRIPQESFDAVAETGAFSISAPTKYGGLAANTRECHAVSRAIAQGDSGLAWVAAILDTATWVLSLMDERAQEDVWGENGGIDDFISIVLSTTSTSEYVDGGLRVSGEWVYGTGSLHAKWSLLGVPITDIDGQIIDAGVALIPTTDLEVQDDWFVSGMRSTASVTQIAREVFVPEHRILPLTAAFEGGYLDENPEVTYKTVFAPSFFMKLVGPQLGMGRAALDFVIDRAATKSIAFTGYEKQSDSSLFQATVARASVDLQAAETVAASVADEIYDGARRNYYAPYGERMRMRAKAAWVVETVSHLISALVTAHGSAGFAETAPLQRIWRDQAVASSHGHTLSATAFEGLGRVIFDQEDEARRMFPVV